VTGCLHPFQPGDQIPGPSQIGKRQEGTAPNRPRIKRLFSQGRFDAIGGQGEWSENFDDLIELDAADAVVE
jgi:hypothetical protein